MNGYPPPSTRNMKAGVPPAVLAAKLACYEEMKALNLKGPRPHATANLAAVQAKHGIE